MGNGTHIPTFLGNQRFFIIDVFDQSKFYINQIFGFQWMTRYWTVNGTILKYVRSHSICPYGNLMFCQIYYKKENNFKEYLTGFWILDFSTFGVLDGTQKLGSSLSCPLAILETDDVLG